MNTYNMVQSLIHTFENVDNNKPIDNFREFLNRHSHVTKWSIASDYCIDDKKNKYDCFSFTIFPYDELPLATFDHIQSKLPRDIKKNKKLPPDAISFFHEANKFHICIVADQRRNLFIPDGHNTSLNKARVQIKADYERAQSSNYSQETLDRLIKLVRKSEAKSFNLRLYENILLLAAFYDFISILLLKEHKSEKIGWFSDRDEMISYCENLIWDFAKSSFYIISNTMGLETTGNEILIAGHRESPDIKDMWYDPLIRSADYLASALSCWHISADGKLNIPDTKQGKLLREAIAGNKNIAILYPKLKNPEIFPIVERVSFS